MPIFNLCQKNTPAAARLMAKVRPDYWDYDGAICQLSDIRNTAFNVGWIIGENEENPKGWLLCVDYELYSCVSVECIGYDTEDQHTLEKQMSFLLQQAECYAKGKGYRIYRYVITSEGLSCHGRTLGEYGDELRDLKSWDSKRFDFFVRYGFKPAGFMPDCYGANFHGVIMIKNLT